MTVSDLAAVTGLSWDTVKHIVKQALEKDCGPPRLKDLHYLSIDEIDLGRQQKFHTLVIDLENGRIVGVAQGKGAEALRQFWRALRLSQAKIAAVTLDRSAASGAAVSENLPDAAVVFDRFHLVKRVHEKLDDLRREMVREATGLMKKTVKGLRYRRLLRREKVREEKLPQLEEARKTNAPLNIGYVLEEALGLLWEQRSPEAMADFLKEWGPWAAESGVRQRQPLAKTLMLHARGILHWWEHRISNGRREGLNHKIKTLLRQTYGLRDERYFILKLYSLHNSRLALLG